MKKEKRVWNKFALINPRNLAREVHVYGYHFSWKAHAVWMIAALMGGGMLGILFHLETSYFLIIAVGISCVFPVLVLDMYKQMYEQKRFSDLAAYMEQMLYSFLKTGKVTGALKETRELYGDGQMRGCLDAAILHIELGKPKTAEGVLSESLKMIEEKYPCIKLATVHNLLTRTEMYGGTAEEAVMLLLEDIERWKKRSYHLQTEKKRCHVDNVVSMATSVVLCAVALYVLDEMRKLFAVGGKTVFSVPIIQVSSTVFILVLLGILVKSTNSLTGNWLDEPEVFEPDYIEHSYELVMDYETGKRKYRKMGYHLAKRDVTEAMYLALPQWLTEMMLLLQHNNVQVALVKSADTASSVLRKELRLLKERMDRQPEKLLTYTMFCRSFDLPEVEGCMKMLHAFSENGAGNVRAQMNQLLGRIWQMQEQANAIQDAKTAFRMRMIFSYPVLAATTKLLLDLTVGMVMLMQMLGGIGGV